MRGIAIYTGLRVALLAAVWLLIQAVTPLRGLLAIALALVILLLLVRPEGLLGRKEAIR